MGKLVTELKSTFLGAHSTDEAQVHAKINESASTFSLDPHFNFYPLTTFVEALVLHEPPNSAIYCCILYLWHAVEQHLEHFGRHQRAVDEDGVRRARALDLAGAGLLCHLDHSKYW